MVPSLFYQNQRKMYADIPFTRCRGSKNTEVRNNEKILFFEILF